MTFIKKNKMTKHRNEKANDHDWSAVSPVERFDLSSLSLAFFLFFFFSKILMEKLVATRVEAPVPKGLLLYKSHDRRHHDYL